MLARAWRYIVLAVVALVAVLLLRACRKDSLPPTAFNIPLPESSAAQVVVTDRHIAVRSRTETKAGYVPDGGTATVMVEKNGQVKLQIQSAGWTFKPVVGPLITSRLRLALGAEIGYWNRCEIYGGGAIGYSNHRLVSPVGFVGLGYRLDQIYLSNTSVYVTYTTGQEIGAGLFWRF